MVSLVLVGCVVAESGVPAQRVVPGLNPVEDRRLRFLTRLERAAAEQLLLERGVEALADGVVVAVTLRAHRLRDPGLAQLLPEDQRDILRPLIRVMDQLVGRLASADRHLERVDDELGLHVGAHRPADDLAAEAVDHRGEVERALPGRDVLDVGGPQPVRPRRVEVALDEIVGDPYAGDAEGGAELAPLHVSRHPGGSHQSLDPLAAQPDPLIAEVEVDPPSAVAVTAARVHPADPLGQRRVGERPRRRWPLLPGVEARARDTEHAAHQRDRVVGLLRRDEPEAAHRVSLSRAKKTAAFFKISRSCSSVRTFRRSSRNSWRSSLVSPSRRPPSTSACRAQIRSVSVETPRSTAISLSGRPDRLYSSTASRRNSGGYGFLKFDPLGMAEHPPCPAGQCRPSAQVSTETGALHLMREIDLRTVADRQEIHQVLMRYSRGIDRGDPEMIASVYHEGAVDQHGPWRFTNAKRELPELTIPRLDALQGVAQHHITNYLIELDGDG